MMEEVGKRLKTLSMAVIPLALMGLVAGCGSGGSSSAGATPVPVPVPTAPANLPALAPDAGGPSAGFNVLTTPAPAAPGALVSPVPEPQPAPDAFTITDQDAAIRLGKALFWDVQTSSDGQIACASCHFRAGADNRTINTVHPGPDATFQRVAGPGAIINFITFDPAVMDDVVGSSGVTSRLFDSISTDPADPVDVCFPLIHGDPAQALFGTEHRLVTGRNTPSAVGAVFYLDNFWDGRASQDFNGQDPLGTGGAVVAGLSSLASQSMGPPLSDIEMSCAGRTWNGPNSIGAKLVPRTPLARQQVHPQDSVLGALANFPGDGLRCFPNRLCTYADLIAAAFGTNGLFGQAAVDFYIDNFSSIWGQAVQAYEATLVPNRTPYDLGTLTALESTGLQEMRDRGCTVCHVEPEFSDATVRLISLRGGPTVQKLVNGDPGGDQGFHNIGVTPTANDRGRAASPGGVYNESVFNEGAFKTPGLRNLALTAPYMHNGSLATIADVLEFYDGGALMLQNNPGFDPAAVSGNANAQFVESVTAFLTTGLIDCRIANQLAPFDHPSLAIPNGPTMPATGRTGSGAVCP